MDCILTIQAARCNVFRRIGEVFVVEGKSLRSFFCPPPSTLRTNPSENPAVRPSGCARRHHRRHQQADRGAIWPP
jgi:hypothetical protein